jgi:aspartyl protease family protein
MKEIATKYIGGARGSSTGGSVEIKTSPNQYNAFFTDVSINGTPMNMIVDTGAAYVSIPLQMAGKLGLSQGTAQAMSTANGVALSYLTTIATLKIGNITLKNVAAQLTPNGTPYGLLGQSALSQLMVTQMDGTMMLRSKPQ